MPSAALGLTSREAIYQACLKRFRPIMMTTMAAMLGALPLAIGFGEGSELRRPLGISIVGGLIVSQLLTLYTTPVIYLYLDRLRLWGGRRWRTPPSAFLFGPYPRTGRMSSVLSRFSCRTLGESKVGMGTWTVTRSAGEGLLRYSQRRFCFRRALSGPIISAPKRPCRRNTRRRAGRSASRSTRLTAAPGGRSTRIRCSTISKNKSTSPTRT